MNTITRRTVIAGAATLLLPPAAALAVPADPAVEAYRAPHSVIGSSGFSSKTTVGGGNIQSLSEATSRSHWLRRRSA